MKWDVDKADGCLWIGIEAAKSLCGSMEKECGIKFKNHLCYVKDFKFKWCCLEQENEEIGHFLVKKFKNNKFKEKFTKDYTRYDKETIAELNKIDKSDFTKISDDELFNIFSRAVKLYIRNFDWSFVMEPMDFVMPNMIESRLIKENYTALEIADMIASPDLSYVHHEKIELMKIAFADDKLLLKEHAYNYRWLLSSHLGRIDIPFKTFNERYQSYNKKSTFKDVKKIYKLQEEIIKRKEELLSKKPIHKDTKELIKISELLAMLHDRRKELFLRTIYTIDTARQEIADRYDYTKEQLTVFDSDVILKLKDGIKINKKLANKLLRSATLYIENNNWVYFSDEKSENFVSCELAINYGSIDEIKGMIASPGKIVGPVVLFNGLNDIKKVKDGDILVTSMTKPEFMPVLRKISAIITDEGGVTCHAAIVARELNVPAVIGTKISSTTLRDGEIVEVDANRGIITKIHHKWKIYTRGTITLHNLGPPLEAIAKRIHKFYSLKRVLYANIGSKLWWAWDENEINQVGKLIWDKTKTKAGSAKHFNFLRKMVNVSIKNAERIINIDKKGLSDKDLANLYDDIENSCYDASAFLNVDVDAVDIYPIEKIKELINKEIKVNTDEFNKIYSTLTAPLIKSYLINEEEEILTLAKKIKQSKKRYESFIKKEYSLIKKDLDELVKKFWWASVGWEQMTTNSAKTYIKKISSKINKNLDEELFSIQTHLKNIKKRRLEIINKYHLSERLQNRLKFFDKYALFHDKRKESQVKVLYARYSILLEVARRTNIKSEYLKWLWPQEIKAILTGNKVNMKLISERKDACVLIVYDKKVFEWTGKIAHKIKSQEVEDMLTLPKEISGETAFNGKVYGTAKVCAGSKDAIKRVKKGNILVCGMTMPDYLPAMKRAAAIVTDEGGITCHAAIVSRELGIPCIVGTKNATSVIKDGDKITVDANNGFVKIEK